jgi:hypothetical protein
MLTVGAPGGGANPAAALLEHEVARRQAAEAKVRALEAQVAQLQQRLARYEGKRERANELPPEPERLPTRDERDEGWTADDAIDQAIWEYLELNPDYPVSIKKVAPNYYSFGDRGTVYLSQRGEHIVVRVGGGFKSLQVFMDERSLMGMRDSSNVSTGVAAADAASPRRVLRPGAAAAAAA